MRVNTLNRIVVAAGIGAVALLGLSVPTYATPQQGQTKQEQQKNQQAQKKQDQAQARQHHQAQVDQQQQRLTQYQGHLDEQQRLAQAQSAQLQQQNRRAQYTVQRQYLGAPPSAAVDGPASGTRQLWPAPLLLDAGDRSVLSRGPVLRDQSVPA